MAFNLSTNVYESDVNQNNNTSIVHVAVTITTSGSSYSNYDHYGTIVIDGTSYSHGPYRLPSNSSVTLQSQKTITHNDATGEYTANWSYSLPVKTTDTRTGSGSIVLTTIPRASQPTFSSSNVILGNSVTINMNRKNSSFTHTLSYSIGNLTEQTSGLSATSGITTSCTFTPPVNLANQFPNSTNGNVVFTCKTYNGSTLVGTKTATLVVNTEDTSTYKPTISLSATSNNLYDNKYLNGVSDITVSAVTTTKFGASVDYYSITGPSGMITDEDLVYDPIDIELRSATATIGFSSSVVDSRGYANADNTGTLEITLYRYNAPTINVTLQRCDSNGTVDNNGTYAKATIEYTYQNDGYGNNIPTDSLVITINSVEYKYSSSDFTETTNNGVVTGTGSKVVGGGNLSINYHFPWDVEITDDVGQSATASGTLASSKRIINTRPQGKGIAFGKFAETDNLLESDWKIKAPDLEVTNDVEVGGDLLVNELNLGNTAKSKIQYNGTSNITQVLPELNGTLNIQRATGYILYASQNLNNVTAWGETMLSSVATSTTLGSGIIINQNTIKINNSTIKKVKVTAGIVAFRSNKPSDVYYRLRFNASTLYRPTILYETVSAINTYRPGNSYSIIRDVSQNDSIQIEFGTGVANTSVEHMGAFIIVEDVTEY